MFYVVPNPMVKRLWLLRNVFPVNPSVLFASRAVKRFQLCTISLTVQFGSGQKTA